MHLFTLFTFDLIAILTALCGVLAISYGYNSRYSYIAVFLPYLARRIPLITAVAVPAQIGLPFFVFAVLATFALTTFSLFKILLNTNLKYLCFLAMVLDALVVVLFLYLNFAR